MLKCEEKHGGNSQKHSTSTKEEKKEINLSESSRASQKINPKGSKETP